MKELSTTKLSKEELPFIYGTDVKTLINKFGMYVFAQLEKTSDYATIRLDTNTEFIFRFVDSFDANKDFSEIKIECGVRKNGTFMTLKEIMDNCF